MSDLERFVDLYRSFGVECIVTPGRESGEQRIVLHEGEFADDDATKSPKFGGYLGFYTEIVFDASGSFLRQGFWE